MNPNPFSDALAFLLQPGWPTPIFWLLLIVAPASPPTLGTRFQTSARYRI